jgi:WD40 repeat protein
MSINAQTPGLLVRCPGCDHTFGAPTAPPRQAYLADEPPAVEGRTSSAPPALKGASESDDPDPGMQMGLILGLSAAVLLVLLLAGWLIWDDLVFVASQAQRPANGASAARSAGWGKVLSPHMSKALPKHLMVPRRPVLVHTLDARDNERTVDLTFTADSRQLVRLVGKGTSQPRFEVWSLATKECRRIPVPDEGVEALRLAPRGNLGAVALPGRRVRLIDLSTGKTTFILDAAEGAGEGEGRAPPLLTFSEDGAILAVFHLTELTLWATRTGKQLGRAPLHHQVPPQAIRAAFRPDGLYLATVLPDRRLVMRHARTGQVLDQFDRVEAVRPVDVTYSPRGETLAVADSDGRVAFLPSIGGRQRAGRDTGVRQQRGVMFTPDGKYLAGCSEESIFLVEWDRKNRFSGWDHGVGRPLRITFAPRGDLFAVAGEEGIRVWDASLYVRMDDLPEPRQPTLDDDQFKIKHPVSESVTDLLITPSGNTLLMRLGSGTLRFFPLPFDFPGRAPGPHATRSGRMVVPPDGKAVLSTHDGKLYVYDIDLASRKAAKFGGEFLALSPDGRLGAVSGRSGVKLFAYPDMTLQPSLPRSSDVRGPVAFSPDGKTLVAVCPLAIFQAWDVSTRTLKWTVDWPGREPKRDDKIAAIGFSSDGKTVFAAGKEALLVGWDAETGRERYRSVHPRAVEPDGTQGHRFQALAPSPADGLLAVCGGINELYLYDTTTGELRCEVRVGIPERAGRGGRFHFPDFFRLEALAFSPDGDTLLGSDGGEVVGWRLDRLKIQPPSARPDR